MKILLIGNGGREHAIAWKLAQSTRVEKIYCAPGNGGTALEEKCENVNLTSSQELVKFAIENFIELTVVGPEAPLCEGVVDLFKEKGLLIFGPNKAGARLEGSKIYSKDFMRKYNIKTAKYKSVYTYEEALEYLNECSFPVVLKADGLAAGKGVVIADSKEMAEKAAAEFMVMDSLKGSGKALVIEEFLQGIEASILAITDGNTIIPFVSSKDHKAIYDGNLGPNTGGMGTIAPNPYYTKEAAKCFEENIMLPTLKGLKQEKIDYRGIIFFGVMITREDVYLLEYNVRMGDPETQVVLSLLESDLVELIEGAVLGTLSEYSAVFKPQHACCIVAASKGYPEKYQINKEITGVCSSGEKVFAAGAQLINGKLVTAGGRVLGVTALGETLDIAVEKAYKAMENIHFDGMYYRKDIGR